MIFKLNHQKFFGKILALLAILLLVFSFSTKNELIVSAFGEQVNVMPGAFLVETGTGYPAYWENSGNALGQDLRPDSDVPEFDQSNSASIIFPKSAISDDQEGDQSDVLDPESDQTSAVENNPIAEPAGEASQDDAEGGEDEELNGGGNSGADAENTDQADDDQASPAVNEQEDEAINVDASQNQNESEAKESSELNQETSADNQDKSEAPSIGDDLPLNMDSEPDNPLSSRIKSFMTAFVAKAIFWTRPDEAQAQNEPDGHDSSLILSDFSLPANYQNQKFGQVDLKLSMAGKSDADTDALKILYFYGGEWLPAGDLLIGGGVSNFANQGYFTLSLEKLKWYEDINSLKIKLLYDRPVENLSVGGQVEIYVDAAWIELSPEEEEMTETPEPEGKVLGAFEADEVMEFKNEYQLSRLSRPKNFQAKEKPEFSFEFKKKKGFIGRLSGSIARLFHDEYKNIKVTAEIQRQDREGLYVKVGEAKATYLKNGQFKIDTGKDGQKLKPGSYRLEITVEGGKITADQTAVFAQDFSWGVLAFNSSQGSYLPGENAYLQMGVLSDIGHTICDADLAMEITAPDGGVAYLNTANGLIIRNPECGPNNVIETPDYYAHYGVGPIGMYKVKLIAKTANGAKEVEDSFEVKDYLPYEIERVGPTRIYPKAGYGMTVRVKANEDFTGDIIEEVPEGFVVTDAKIINQQAPITKQISITNDQSLHNGRKNIVWHDIGLVAGEEIELSYVFDAPDVWPEFYLLGPLRMKKAGASGSGSFTSSNSEEVQDDGVFTDSRPWQIASDADIGNVVVNSIPINGGTADTANWTDIIVATSTLFTGGNKYFVYITSGFAGSAAGVNTDFEIVYGSTSVYTGLIEASGDEAYDSQQISWFDVMDQPSTPQNIVLRYRTNSGTSYAMNAQLMAISLSELTTNDWKYASSTGSRSLTTTATADASITMDIANSVKDWLVFAMDEIDITRDDRRYISHIYNGSTAYMEYYREGQDTTELLPHVLYRPFDNVATNTVFSIRNYSSTAADTHLKSRIFALNLNKFESFKTYYADINVSLGAAFTEVGNLNSGGNYSPVNTGNQFIFSSFINDISAGTAETDTRLQVNNTTVPASWGWGQSPAGYFTAYDTNEQLLNNISAYTSIPSTGQTIDLDAIEIADTSQVGDEVSMTVFSAALYVPPSYPPTGSFNSAAQKSDGSGMVDVSFAADDGNDEDLKAKIQYVAGSTCNFTFPNQATVDATDANTTATYGDPKVDNLLDYQIGSSTGWITTASGSNTVNFDWDTITDSLGAADGTYCLRLTLNDGTADQTTPATTTLTIDNVDPTVPGQLSATSTDGISVRLTFGASSTESHFSEYRIFYRQGSSGVTESDTEVIDANLGDQGYNGATTTLIEDLSPQTTYVFNIWAYDIYGNKASSTETVITTPAAENRRANSVMFSAGTYTGGATTGQNSNTSYAFLPFYPKLAEQDAVIKSAYVLFEAQFEAYGDNTGDYSGYTLAFDACSEPCTADALAGADRVSVTDSTVLAYGDTESNQVRLLFDVTDQAVLSAYSGSGAALEAQVAYRINRSSAVNSIANTKALLVVTYEHDLDTESFTNTVAYPLASNAAGDSGTRRASIGTCSRSGTCPTFNYNMQIPESNGTSTRLDYWFKFHETNDANNTTDIDVDINLNRVNYSAVFHHESSLGGTQGHIPVMYFTPVTGYSDNTSQNVEYYMTAGTNFLIGGEVFQTYMASTSAAVKTRTVSFPIGVIQPGGITAQRTGYVDVYFPENGSATGTVDIKSVWFRIQSSSYTSGADTITVASKSGSNATTSSYVYNYNMGGTVVKPTMRVTHVMPAAEYAQLEEANAGQPARVILSTTNSNANSGGVSAEMVITYTYSSETNGYLSSLQLFAGQSATNGNDRSEIATASKMLLPEAVGTKTMLAAFLNPSYLFSASGDAMPGANFTMDANVSTGTPVCSDAFISGADGSNSFAEYFDNVTSVLSTRNKTQYYTCFSNNGGGVGAAGGKMNAQLVYTYQWDAPQPYYTQNSWRWFDNADNVQPGAAKAAEKGGVENINLGEILRLRMNMAVSQIDLSTSSAVFILQYGAGSDCAVVSSWTSVGGLASTEAWRGYHNSSMTDGNSSGSVLLASSTVFETYEESNPGASNPFELPVGSIGEWDWTLYDFAATSSTNYCFRMALSNGDPLSDYGADSYAFLATAASNTAPAYPASLSQYRNDTSVLIPNGNWINTNSVKLFSGATDVNISEMLGLYYQLIPSADSFLTATTQPSGACMSGTAYSVCSSKVWAATSTLADYRVAPFAATATVALISTSTENYKWQVMACDDGVVCSGWSNPGATPNLRIDMTPPTAPGPLVFATSTATTITIQYGATTTETNFYEYRIYYKAGSAGVTEANTRYNTASLGYIDFNGATSTTPSSLTAGTQYVFNIWAYDQAGNKASATVEMVGTTSSSFTPPTGSILSAVQKTDGSGAIDISVSADDPDNDNTLRAKLEYDSGLDCTFPGLDTYLDETDENTTAVYGDPKVENDNEYQVGNSSGWIITSSGQNFAFFDWLSKENVPDANDTYCIKMTLYDGYMTQVSTTTKLLVIDNTPPAAPAPLGYYSGNGYSATLSLNTPYSSDTRFSEYRIYYSTSSPATTAGVRHSDSNLSAANYSLATSTFVTGLMPDTTYYFNIWAYDQLGNNSSSTQISFKTNAVPTSTTAINQFKADGATAIPNGGWTNESEVRLRASANDNDASETITLYFEFIPNTGSFRTATSAPAGACAWGTAYNTCSSKVWFVASSSPDNYSVTPYAETVSITSISSSTYEFKWQVLACDSKGDCAASWTQYNPSTPNVKVDYVAPTAPGSLYEYDTQTQSISAGFGASSTEANFRQYIVYYATSSSVSESSYVHSSSTDANLAYMNYNYAAYTNISGLVPNTQYYFAIWAYDQAGNKASSSAVSIYTEPIVSTPGVIFYTKNTRSLFYKLWTGTGWGQEKTGPTLGSGATDYIRHVRAERSDDGKRIAVLAKTWDGTNQEWWATVYRVAADDFVNSTQLNATPYAAATRNQLMTACIGALSGDEFIIVRRNNGSDGTVVHSWSSAAGWTNEGAGPDPVAVLAGCELERRPGTDNYLLMTFDEDSDVGSAYYYGGSTYANTWTSWTQASGGEEDIDNYVGEAYFDPSDNTRGALYYSNSNANFYAYAQKFTVSDNNIILGTSVSSPTAGTEDWNDDFVHGEFFPDPGSTGKAYFIGDDITYHLNVYSVDVSGTQPAWSTLTNGDNISGAGLYAYTNDSQKPYTVNFYKSGRGIALWNASAASAPLYRLINASSGSLDASNSSVPGADSNAWVRVRAFDDPNEDEFVAVYQNDDVDYAALFFDGYNNRFYNSTNNPGSGQIWTEIATTTGAFDRDDECASFAFTSLNAESDNASGLAQYKADGTTAIANGAWTNESTVNFSMSATDADTSEALSVYLELIPIASSSATQTTVPTGACASTTAYTACDSKIWLVAASSIGDYSVTPFRATATIASISDASAGYKWQVLICDDSSSCSAWTKFNLTTPNFKVDTQAPSPAPGALTVASLNSSSVTLNFGATTSDPNFKEYRIYYKIGSSGVLDTDTEWDDTDLDYINYNGTTQTIVTGLASSTQFVFNIWAYDWAGNKATATPEVSTTTAALPYIRQSGYLLENDDGANVNSNSSEVASNTSLTNLYLGERVNARLQIANTGGDALTGKTFKLQFENQTDSAGTWTDVGAATQISYSLGLSGANGAAITSPKIGSSTKIWTNGTWHENTGQTGSFTLTNGYYSEFAFAVQTKNALAGKTYRLRLYNTTDNQTLGNYAYYPTITTAASPTLRHSKETAGSLPATGADLAYFLDPEGYVDVSADDGSNRDEVTASGQYAIANFITKNSTSSQAITATWNGQSSVAASVKAIYLQVYRFGSTNAWVTIASSSIAIADSDFTLTGTVNSYLSEHYDGSYWTYWRVYQDSGTQNLKTDYFNTAFSAPTAAVGQYHFRWRNDNGNETAAAWRETEDTGDPTLGTALNKLQNVRLRMEVANLGAGSASSYQYSLEYASSSIGCGSDPGGWLPVLSTSAGHWQTASSTYFADAATTSAQLANSESYTFTAGRLVEYPSTSTAAITLAERNFTEIEFNMFATNNAITGGTYCFRVTRQGTVLNSYSKYAGLSLSGVTNTAPAFTEHPSDNGSATSSPVNYGDNVQFRGTAADPESNDYYLAVCKTNSITAGNDGPPTCGGGSWCVSALASSTVEASCNYQAATTSQSLHWYAFACDKMPGFSVAKCSAMSQGTGDEDNDSPFVVNHAPVFSAVSTTDNNKNPGGTFTISATAYDNDDLGTADTLFLYVCRTNSATFADGCASGQEVCSSASAPSPNPSCQYVDTAPTPQGANTYYAFVYDSHQMAASANSRSSTYTINNTVPTLGSLVLNGGSQIVVNMKGMSDTSISTVNMSVSDQNGCGALVSASAAIYMSNVTNGYNCTADNNLCYQITSGNCVKSACDGADDTTSTYTCTALLKHYASPTDDSDGNPLKNYNWLSYLNVYDGSNYAATTSAGVELRTNAALDVPEDVIDFGNTMHAGDNTGSTNQSVNVDNIGNAPLDVNLAGTDMDGDMGDYIEAANIQWSFDAFSYGGGSPLLTSGDDIDIYSPKPTSTRPVSDALYWGLYIPYGSNSSLYVGQNTFVGFVDMDGW